MIPGVPDPGMYGLDHKRGMMGDLAPVIHQFDDVLCAPESPEFDYRLVLDFLQLAINRLEKYGRPQQKVTFYRR
jgi:hypothetical protein